MVTQAYGPYGVYRNETLEQTWPLKQWNLIFFLPVQVSSCSLESFSSWEVEEQRTGMAEQCYKDKILKVLGGGVDSTETNTKVNPKWWTRNPTDAVQNNSAQSVQPRELWKLFPSQIKVCGNLHCSQVIFKVHISHLIKIPAVRTSHSWLLLELCSSSWQCLRAQISINSDIPGLLLLPRFLSCSTCCVPSLQDVSLMSVQ